MSIVTAGSDFLLLLPTKEGGEALMLNNYDEFQNDSVFESLDARLNTFIESKGNLGMNECFSSLILEIFKVLHPKRTKNYVQTLRDDWFKDNKKELKHWLLNKVAITSETRAKLVEEMALGSLQIEENFIVFVPIEEFQEIDGKWVHPLLIKEEDSINLRKEILIESSKIFSDEKEKIKEDSLIVRYKSKGKFELDKQFTFLLLDIGKILYPKRSKSLVHIHLLKTTIKERNYEVDSDRIPFYASALAWGGV